MSKVYKNKEIKIVNISERYYYVIYPENINEETSILIFYHENNENAWTSLTKTQLIDTIDINNYILIFGQSSKLEDKNIIWNINDIDYTKTIIENEGANRKINFIGYGEGGLFAWLLAINIPNNFQNIVSYIDQTSFQNLALYDINFVKKHANNFTKMLFYSGSEKFELEIEKITNDFKNNGYSCVLMSREQNSYDYNTEEKILEFIFTKKYDHLININYELLDLSKIEYSDSEEDIDWPSFS